MDELCIQLAFVSIYLGQPFEDSNYQGLYLAKGFAGHWMGNICQISLQTRPNCVFCPAKSAKREVLQSERQTIPCNRGICEDDVPLESFQLIVLHVVC